MNKEKLSKMADMAGEHAQAIIVGLGKDLVPTWVLVDQDEKIHIMGTPWHDDLEKNAIGALLRREIRARKIKAYSLVTEAWAAPAPEGWQEGDLAPPPAREHLARREIVIALATDGTHIEWRQWETKRNHLEQVYALEPIPISGGDHLTSWMSELLSKELSREGE
jgi:hypothetical protein